MIVFTLQHSNDNLIFLPEDICQERVSTSGPLVCATKLVTSRPSYKSRTPRIIAFLNYCGIIAKYLPIKLLMQIIPIVTAIYSTDMYNNDILNRVFELSSD